MRRPNILLLFPDQWRADWIGCAGSGIPVRTPQVDALAGRGTRFIHCRVTSPLCAPSRAGLSLGLRYHRAGVADNRVSTDAQRPTVWRLLRDGGYRVATCGKNDIHKADGPWTVDGFSPALAWLGFTDAIEHAGKWDSLGKSRRGDPELYWQYLERHGWLDRYREDMGARRTRPISTAPSVLPREHYTDDLCGRNALALLARMPADQPWCLWVNFPGPHEPFDPPRELQRRTDAVDFPPPVAAAPAEDHQGIRRNYAAMISGIDDWVGHLIAAVAERGESERTVVIFCSDHGDQLGDHGLFGKQVPYDGSLRVPLLVAGPGVAAGGVSEALVELIDLAATCLDLGGVEAPSGWDARSIAPALRRPGETLRALQVAQLANGVPDQHHDWLAVTDGRWKQVAWRDGDRRLFDLGSDPGETVDRMRDAPSEAARFEAALRAECGFGFDSWPR
jgi:arylsulfatase A-like enzyme